MFQTIIDEINENPIPKAAKINSFRDFFTTITAKTKTIEELTSRDSKLKTENRENINELNAHRYNESQKINDDNAQTSVVNTNNSEINEQSDTVNAKHSGFNALTTKVSELNTAINTNINTVNASNITMKALTTNVNANRSVDGA